jgi:serine/threonine protein kinase
MKTSKIGKYRLFKTLGEGSFAKVKSNTYLTKVGEHENIKQRVAVKILNKGLLKTKDLESKIMREIRFSRYFNHPNIIRLFEVLETNNEIFLIMEYASGGELYNLIYNGKVKTINRS